MTSTLQTDPVAAAPAGPVDNLVQPRDVEIPPLPANTNQYEALYAQLTAIPFIAAIGGSAMGGVVMVQLQEQIQQLFGHPDPPALPTLDQINNATTANQFNTIGDQLQDFLEYIEGAFTLDIDIPPPDVWAIFAQRAQLTVYVTQAQALRELADLLYRNYNSAYRSFSFYNGRLIDVYDERIALRIELINGNISQERRDAINKQLDMSEITVKVLRQLADEQWNRLNKIRPRLIAAQAQAPQAANYAVYLGRGVHLSVARFEYLRRQYFRLYHAYLRARGIDPNFSDPPHVYGSDSPYPVGSDSPYPISTSVGPYPAPADAAAAPPLQAIDVTSSRLPYGRTAVFPIRARSREFLDDGVIVPIIEISINRLAGAIEVITLDRNGAIGQIVGVEISQPMISPAGLVTYSLRTYNQSGQTGEEILITYDNSFGNLMTVVFLAEDGRPSWRQWYPRRA